MVRYSQTKAEKGLKKKVSEDRHGGPVSKKRPPQATNLIPDPEDEGKSYAGKSSAEDLGADGEKLRPKKMRDFDIYRDHR